METGRGSLLEEHPPAASSPAPADTANWETDLAAAVGPEREARLRLQPWPWMLWMTSTRGVASSQKNPLEKCFRHSALVCASKGAAIRVTAVMLMSDCVHCTPLGMGMVRRLVNTTQEDGVCLMLLRFPASSPATRRFVRGCRVGPSCPTSRPSCHLQSAQSVLLAPGSLCRWAGFPEIFPYVCR